MPCVSFNILHLSLKDLSFDSCNTLDVKSINLDISTNNKRHSIMKLSNIILDLDGRNNDAFSDASEEEFKIVHEDDDQDFSKG